MNLNGRNIKSPVRLRPLSLDIEHIMRKKKNDPRITMASIFPPTFILDKSHRGI